MYIQLTEKCNFHCKHCCMSATSKGEDMSLETFRNALKWGDECISIGGGEPTLHKYFWQMLMEAVAVSESVWMATNGSNKEISIALAGLAKKGVLGVALSLDKFHDKISDEVVEAFSEGKISHYSGDDKYPRDGREIRNVEKNLIKAGRCKTGKVGCACEDIFCKPNGDIHLCGCKSAKLIGNVNNPTPIELPDDYIAGECSVIRPDYNIKPVKYDNVEIVDGIKL